MQPQHPQISVTILDKQYRITCPPGAEQGLQEAAKYLDEQMRSIRLRGRIIGIERIAIMAALHIAYMHLNASPSDTDPNDHALNQRLNDLKERIDDALAESSSFSETGSEIT